MDNTFLPLLFRMKYIHRWGLMYSTQKEDLMQHSMECSLVANFLATVGNRFFEKHYDINKITVCALFHDTPEVLTGDLPTPIKYFNAEMINVYKHIEAIASDKLVSHLPKELMADYSAYLNGDGLSDGEKQILKISDKVCAYLKCIYELNAGNKEFQTAYLTIRKDIENIDSKELKYFLDHCLSAFSLSLDDLKGTL